MVGFKIHRFHNHNLVRGGSDCWL